MPLRHVLATICAASSASGAPRRAAFAAGRTFAARRSLRASVATSAASASAAPAADTLGGGASAVPEGGLKSPLLRTLHERGFLFQCTNFAELDAKMAAGSVSAYLGFDATAGSLHVGSLLQIMALRHLQRHGHKPIVLVGGGTTKVGDPTGKDASRKILSEDAIAANIAGISGVFSKFLAFGDGPSDAVLVNNDEWLGELNYMDFLRDYGRHFSINRMMAMESVKLRLSREQPLSFLEFNYMILQAYDFLALHRSRGATVQFGGADQWGNIINGVDLGRRCDGAELYGVTAPLITTADGKKMGKSEGGAAWLNADMLSPYDYWQFWRNTDDRDVARFLLLFTDVPVDEVDAIAGPAVAGAAVNAAKVRLADEATALLHGADCLGAIRETAKAVFESGGAGGGSALPTVDVPAADLVEGVGVIDLFVRLDLAKSKSEARRLIKGGGARLNGVSIADELLVLTRADFGDETSVKLSSGKKRHGLVVVAE